VSNIHSAHDLGEAWLAYVTELFILTDGKIRPQVEEEFEHLESTDSIARERELWRKHTDALMDKIIQTPPELRHQLLSDTDSRSLAYVQDRIQCGTELLAAIIQKGLQINLDDKTTLPDFFKQILFQKQV